MEENKFLKRTKEKADFNQYWYSKPTIDAMVSEVLANARCAAFLSTPSVYFSLPDDSDVRKNSIVLDIDPVFKKDPNFVMYDYHHPEAIPAKYEKQFDYVVIDPPFITEEVWRLYTEAAARLLKDGGKILLSTIQENADMMKALLNVAPCKFMPSIPHLVYQYFFYTNYEPAVLNTSNPEIPE
eukprot:ANDGO_04392.mRNA.1 Protein-lysine N-methyltransferase DDB_G0272708